jgi:hypothetical protein
MGSWKYFDAGSTDVQTRSLKRGIRLRLRSFRRNSSTGWTDAKQGDSPGHCLGPVEATSTWRNLGPSQGYTSRSKSHRTASGVQSTAPRSRVHLAQYLRSPYVHYCGVEQGSQATAESRALVLLIRPAVQAVITTDGTVATHWCVSISHRTITIVILPSLRLKPLDTRSRGSQATCRFRTAFRPV